MVPATSHAEIIPVVPGLHLSRLSASAGAANGQLLPTFPNLSPFPSFRVMTKPG